MTQAEEIKHAQYFRLESHIKKLYLEVWRFRDVGEEWEEQPQVTRQRFPSFEVFKHFVEMWTKGHCDRIYRLKPPVTP